MDLLKMNVANETGQITTVTIEQAGKYDGQEVTLKGWLYNLRESGKLLFPIFRDGTGIIQGDRYRQNSRGETRNRRVRNWRHKNQDRPESSRKHALPHPAQGAWR